MPRSFTQRSRVAVVTGGASGIGEATCHHLAERGHRVAVLDLDGEGANRVAKDVRAAGVEALGFAVDVTDRPAIDAAFAEIRSALGPTEILVTSAGLVAFDAFDQITLEQWDRVVGVNLTGTFHCCQAALPDMVAARWGRIVTIASSSAQRGSPNMAHYAAAKGGVIVLTKSLARAYAAHGITVNTIPPSGIETPMQHQSQADGNLPANEVMAGTIPLGHLGTPDDIAAAAAFLASDAAGFITGQVLGVNGGSVLLTPFAGPRMGPLPVAEWADEDRELLRGNLPRADRYLSGDVDAPPMPPILGLFARHARVSAPWLAFSGTLLDAGALVPRDRELLILRVGSRTRCRYQWAEHVGMARAAGLTAERIAAVPEGARAEVWTDRERDLLRAVDQLVDDHVIDDATWGRLTTHFDERQLLELIFVVGSYACLAMVLNSAGLEPTQ